MAVPSYWAKDDGGDGPGDGPGGDSPGGEGPGDQGGRPGGQNGWYWYGPGGPPPGVLGPQTAQVGPPQTPFAVQPAKPFTGSSYDVGIIPSPYYSLTEQLQAAQRPIKPAQQNYPWFQPGQTAATGHAWAKSLADSVNQQAYFTGQQAPGWSGGVGFNPFPGGGPGMANNLPPPGGFDPGGLGGVNPPTLPPQGTPTTPGIPSNPNGYDVNGTPIAPPPNDNRSMFPMRQDWSGQPGFAPNSTDPYFRDLVANSYEQGYSAPSAQTPWRRDAGGTPDPIGVDQWSALARYAKGNPTFLSSLSQQMSPTNYANLLYQIANG